MDLPVLKTQRYRDVKRRNSNRTVKLAEACFVPGPNAKTYPGGEENFILKAGPGMGTIPKEGKWLVVTTYLLRRVRDGDAAEASPAQVKALAAVAKKTKIAECEAALKSAKKSKDKDAVEAATAALKEAKE